MISYLWDLVCPFEFSLSRGRLHQHHHIINFGSPPLSLPLPLLSLSLSLSLSPLSLLPLSPNRQMRSWNFDPTATTRSLWCHETAHRQRQQQQQWQQQIQAQINYNNSSYNISHVTDWITGTDAFSMGYYRLVNNKADQFINRERQEMREKESDTWVTERAVCARFIKLKNSIIIYFYKLYVKLKLVKIYIGEKNCASPAQPAPCRPSLQWPIIVKIWRP